jgi:hypothetical protein
MDLGAHVQHVSLNVDNRVLHLFRTFNFAKSDARTKEPNTSLNIPEEALVKAFFPLTPSRRLSKDTCWPLYVGKISSLIAFSAEDGTKNQSAVGRG